MNWQPIETAPKDGTNILVCSGRKKVCISFWMKIGGFYAGSDRDGWHTWVTDGSYALTHWMPLPEPPQ